MSLNNTSEDQTIRDISKFEVMRFMSSLPSNTRRHPLIPELKDGDKLTFTCDGMKHTVTAEGKKN